jgi:hypothetical protein
MKASEVGGKIQREIFDLPSLRCGVFENPEKLTVENGGPTKPVSSQKSLTEVSEQRPVAADDHRAAR